MGEGDFATQRFGRLKGDGVLHRKLRNAGKASQHRPVGHEGYPPVVGQSLLQRVVILVGVDVGAHSFQIVCGFRGREVEGVDDGVGHVAVENLGRRAPQDHPASRGHLHLESQLDSVRGHGTSGTLEYLLAGSGDLHSAAAVALDFAVKGSDEEIGDGDALLARLNETRGKPHLLRRRLNS